MDEAKLQITPKTKVGELLEAYPGLEEVLLTISPSFAALKNPVLRRTVGRVATLSQAAAVGGVRVDELVNRLRAEVGQRAMGDESEEGIYIMSDLPVWYNPERVSDRFDATPVINSGESPMAEILRRANNLEPEAILEITSPFVPAPVLDLLKSKGFKVFALEREGTIVSFIAKE
jgi:hypothetical protein